MNTLFRELTNRISGFEDDSLPFQTTPYLHKKTWSYEIVILLKNEMLCCYFNLTPPLKPEEQELLDASKNSGLCGFHYWNPMARILNDQGLNVLCFQNPKLSTHLYFEGGVQNVLDLLSCIEKNNVNLTVCAIESLHKLKDRYAQ